MSGFRPRFFIEQTDHLGPSDVLVTTGAEVMLSAQDSHHASRVLRLKTDDICEVVVGAAVYAARVSSAKDPVKVLLGERLKAADAGALYRTRVGLVQALTRPALLDLILEKGTEVGASYFVLVTAAESTRLSDSARVSRMERWRRIVMEAAKQSKQSAIPSIELVESVEAANKLLGTEGVFSLVLEPSASSSLREVLEVSQLSSPSSDALGEQVEGAPSDIALWVGPESGWTADELGQFAAAGIQGARLGQSVLRAETAGPVAVALTRLVIGDW